MENGKKFPVKDVIYIVVLIFGIAGNYFKSRYDIASNTDKIIELKKDIDMYEARLTVYSGLPSQVKELGETVENNAKMLNVIHDGLVAKGIIPPRRN